ncbi:MAG: hypothetical protein HRT44_00820 [Bdellovibrionales bacterium]|nr:hypothetical protein [Bdellovibrionales bacterium]NQZ17792.1 hypothetical protein [Bdellovibrionales bacterium]
MFKKTLLATICVLLSFSAAFAGQLSTLVDQERAELAAQRELSDQEQQRLNLATLTSLIVCIEEGFNDPHWSKCSIPRPNTAYLVRMFDGHTNEFQFLRMSYSSDHYDAADKARIARANESLQLLIEQRNARLEAARQQQQQSK